MGALEKIKNHIFKLIMLGGITMLLFYSYFVYTGYQFWNTMQEKCACANGWQKYYIYAQTTVLFLIILSTVIFTGYVSVKKMPVGLIANAVMNNALAKGQANKRSSGRKSNKSKA